MLRPASLFGAALSALALSASALGADAGFNDDYADLRGSYPEEWGFSEEPDPLDFELGVRYWYSLGAFKMNAFGADYSSSDVSHIMEAFFRVDDNSTASFLKGNIGYAAVINGTYSTPEFVGDQTMAGGYIGYAGADFGMMPFGNEFARFGAFAGYQFTADNPDMGRSSFVTSTGGGDSQTNMTEIHALKLGATFNADLGDMVDLNLEAAFIPYAKLQGTFGALHLPDFVSGGTTFTQGSAGNIDGRLYGASGEAMLGFHPTDNLSIRVGARAWYLTGEATVDVLAREAGSPANQQRYIDNITGLEFFRYGALAEITGRF